MVSAKSGICGIMKSLVTLSMICVSIVASSQTVSSEVVCGQSLLRYKPVTNTTSTTLTEHVQGASLIDIATTRPHLNSCVHMSLKMEPLVTTSLCTSLERRINMLLCLHRTETCLGQAVAECSGVLEVWNEAASC